LNYLHILKDLSFGGISVNGWNLIVRACALVFVGVGAWLIRKSEFIHSVTINSTRFCV